MKKLVYALTTYQQDFKNKTYEKLRLCTDSTILIGRAVALPRNKPSEFHDTWYPIPTSKHTPKSFSEITNDRVNDVIGAAKGNDLPIIAYWSGGIDSTVIVSALVKHLPRDMLERVIIKMSNASYVENPYFFKNVINKNNIQYTLNTTYDYRNAIILHGDPADALWLGGNILGLAAEIPNAHTLSIRSHKDIIIAELAEKTNEDYAEWFYEYIISNAEHSNFHLQTISDFYWWVIFNFNLTPMCLKHLAESSEPDLDLYFKNFIPWYVSDEYQLWSINSQPHNIKFDGSIRSYKMPAKAYIYDLDKNQRYRDYKTKMHSQYVTRNQAEKVMAIYNNKEIVRG